MISFTFDWGTDSLRGRHANTTTSSPTSGWGGGPRPAGLPGRFDARLVRVGAQPFARSGNGVRPEWPSEARQPGATMFVARSCPTVPGCSLWTWQWPDAAGELDDDLYW